MNKRHFDVFFASLLLYFLNNILDEFYAFILKTGLFFIFDDFFVFLRNFHLTNCLKKHLIWIQVHHISSQIRCLDTLSQHNFSALMPDEFFTVTYSFSAVIHLKCIESRNRRKISSFSSCFQKFVWKYVQISFLMKKSIIVNHGEDVFHEKTKRVAKFI